MLLGLWQWLSCFLIALTKSCHYPVTLSKVFSFFKFLLPLTSRLHFSAPHTCSSSALHPPTHHPHPHTSVARKALCTPTLLCPCIPVHTQHPSLPPPSGASRHSHDIVAGPAGPHNPSATPDTFLGITSMPPAEPTPIPVPPLYPDSHGSWLPHSDRPPSTRPTLTRSPRKPLYRSALAAHTCPTAGD